MASVFSSWLLLATIMVTHIYSKIFLQYLIFIYSYFFLFNTLADFEHLYSVLRAISSNNC